MRTRTYKAKKDTLYGSRVVPEGTEMTYHDNDAPDPELWECLDPEGHPEPVAPHWADTMPQEVLAALQFYPSVEEALQALSVGAVVCKAGLTVEDLHEEVLTGLKFFPTTHEALEAMSVGAAARKAGHGVTDFTDGEGNPVHLVKPGVDPAPGADGAANTGKSGKNK